MAPKQVQSSRCLWLLPLVVGMGVLFVAVPTATADEDEGGTPAVMRIEEDWMLVLNEPNDTVESPQFHTRMSAFPGLESYYAQVVWNYRELPEFTPGGLQLQSWHAETRIRSRTVRFEALSTAAETITWTQALETDGLMLSFEIFNGQSTTWGAFGRDMRIDEDAAIPDLSQYTTDASMRNSWITFGSNRVDLWAITEVRYYDADGNLLRTDTQPKIVYEAPDVELH